jgi:CheY-like chemotaxis protein
VTVRTLRHAYRLAMPNMNGPQFLRQLRLNARFSQTPVLLVSGLPEAATGPWAADRHLLGRLVKGRFRLTELVAIMAGAIASSAVDGDGRPMPP